LNELIELAAELQKFCIERDWKFCFIGGLVVQHWSEPRTTKDVDITLLTGFGNEEAYIDEWLRHYEPRRPDAREFALTRRVLVLWSKAKLGIDIALGALSCERDCVLRARDIEVCRGATLRFCSPEDLIVMKAFANRDRDWRDVKMTILKQKDTLDWNYIQKQLEPLVILKEEPEILIQLKLLRKQCSSRAN
jgi:hypothetical protein